MDRRVVEYADWQAGLEVGISIIDDQHRRLFELAATFQGDGDQIRVMKTLALLMDYIKTHLRDEEELMEACAYPRLAEHKRMHADFRQMLLSLLERAKRLSLDEIAEDVKFMINGWFFKHIMVADQDYAPYVRAYQASQGHQKAMPEGNSQQEPLDDAADHASD